MKKKIEKNHSHSNLKNHIHGNRTSNTFYLVFSCQNFIIIRKNDYSDKYNHLGFRLLQRI